MARQERSSALLLVAVGASLWGTDAVLRKPLAGSLTSLEVVFCEHLLLSLILLPVAIATYAQWRRMNLRQWAAMLWIAWGGSALALLCFTEAIRAGNPTTAVLLQKTQPVFAMLLASVALGEVITQRRWIYLGVAMAAVYVLSFGAGGFQTLLSPAETAAGQGRAVALALVAAVLWAGTTVWSRYLAPGLSFVAVSALRIVVAFPLLAALLAVRGHTHFSQVTSKQLLALVWMALVPGLLALLIYYRGLQNTLASQAAIAELCFPATATMLNWIFLGSRLTALQVSAFLFLWGVIAKMQRERTETADFADSAESAI